LPSRAYPRTALWILAAVLALAVSAACTSTKGNSGTDSTAMNAIAEQIQTELGGQPGVVSAKVVYQNSVTASGAAMVNLSIKPGTDVDTTISAAVRTVWLSKLNPLSSIRIDIVYYQSQQRGIVKYFIVKDDQTQLEQMYGPRPT
jgi:hypothetical protein